MITSCLLASITQLSIGLGPICTTCCQSLEYLNLMLLVKWWKICISTTGRLEARKTWPPGLLTWDEYLICKSYWYFKKIQIPVWRRFHAEGTRVSDGRGKLKIQPVLLLPNKPLYQKELILLFVWGRHTLSEECGAGTTRWNHLQLEKGRGLSPQQINNTIPPGTTHADEMMYMFNFNLPIVLCPLDEFICEYKI